MWIWIFGLKPVGLWINWCLVNIFSLNLFRDSFAMSHSIHRKRLKWAKSLVTKCLCRMSLATTISLTLYLIFNTYIWQCNWPIWLSIPHIKVWATGRYLGCATWWYDVDFGGGLCRVEWLVVGLLCVTKEVMIGCAANGCTMGSSNNYKQLVVMYFQTQGGVCWMDTLN